MIKLIHVSKSYTDLSGQTHAVNDVSLMIKSGEILGIIGKSGAGKSTLIRLLNRLILPSSGDIYVDGVDLLSLKRKAIERMRQNMGMIFQYFYLMSSKTVFENIAFSLEIAKADKTLIAPWVHELLEEVGMLHKKDKYPSELSGGEKQRVAIARALANRPKYLLCDEATSALDPETADAILRLLKKINQDHQITIVFITHQMQVIQKICDRVVVMEHGKIVESGAVKDVFTHPQARVTKEFLKDIINQEEGLIQSDKPLYKILYHGVQGHSPILSQTIQRFACEINIMHAKITPLQDKTLGFMVVSVEGIEANEALAYLSSQGCEVSEYVG